MRFCELNYPGAAGKRVFFSFFLRNLFKDAAHFIRKKLSSLILLDIVIYNILAIQNIASF